MNRRASFTSVLIECYSSVGDWLSSFIKRAEENANPYGWQLMFIGELLLLAAFVIATPAMFAWAAARWLRLRWAA